MSMTRTLPRALRAVRRLRRWREGKVRPVPGNAPHQPAGKPGAFFTSWKERLRPSLRRHSEPQRANNTGAPRWRFLRHDGIYQSDVGSFEPSLDRSHCLPPAAPDPSARTRREDRILLIVLMSSGRLFLERVGRHQSPSPLRRHDQLNMHFRSAHLKPERSTLLRSGSFYFALTYQKRLHPGASK